MRFTGRSGEFLYLERIDSETCKVISEKMESSLTVLWFEDEENILEIDGREEMFKANELVFLTEFHRVVPRKIGAIRFLRFNRPFYCILDHDSEVGCKGLLFFGAAKLPRIHIPETELETFTTLWRMFCQEMSSADKHQIEMLQMMLKRYLILCARLYKQQNTEGLLSEDVEIVREFNFLVEKNFRTGMIVSDYAELLHKSPKTLSNLFAELGHKSPLQFIQERRALEARRLLRYSTKQVQEIAYELGYGDIQAFSRFFKKQEGVSPRAYREALAKN